MTLSRRRRITETLSVGDGHEADRCSGDYCGANAGGMRFHNGSAVGFSPHRRRTRACGLAPDPGFHRRLSLGLSEPRLSRRTFRLWRRAGCGRSGCCRLFPSITFPNHYTLVTGLYPDHHGIVNNRFEDANLPGVFRMTTKEEAWWDEGTPIWVSAERQGVRTATEFWPGSEVAIHGVRPRSMGALQPSQDQQRARGYAARLAQCAAGDATPVPDPSTSISSTRPVTTTVPIRLR